ncbi:MAG: PHP domain-containing protein [Oscillospiraceae bacterium]
MNYTAYHIHSDYSVLDSCTNFKLYVDKAVELGQKAIAFTEHGRPLGWVAKKMYCDEKGIKFIRGVECYLTEKLYEDEDAKIKIRDNYHTILIAKNDAGAAEIYEAIYRSTQPDHVYYENRITFDEFLRLSDNVIKISACVASPLCRLSITHPMYERLAKKYDYYEIQPHLMQTQVDYNRHLAMLAEKYNKPLIAATDAHSVDSYKAKCREILLRSKNKWYGDDGCDLTYKSYDDLVEAFRKQDAIPEPLWMAAIENTNVMADSVEDFSIDTAIKYPILYGSAERDTEMFRETVYRKYQEKLDEGIIPPEQKADFDRDLEEELRVFEKVGMSGFMLSMSENISWCHEHGIPTGNARGSVGGSRAAYVADIIDLNPVTWKTVFSRFCNEDRKEIGDIDIDLIESDRPAVFQHIIQRFGERKTARVPSYGTLVERGTIEHVVKGLASKRSGLDNKSKVDWKDVTYNGVPVPTVINAVKELFLSDEAKAREQYPEIFKYYDGIIGTKTSYSVHPAGIVISPIDLISNYGVFIKDGENVMMIDMDEIHEVGLAKYDFLILKNVGIIQDTFKMIGKPYPRSDEIDWNDQRVWADMITSPVGIFQMEGDYAFNLLKKYQPHSIFDMSLVTAAIRPSGGSYRDALIAHKPNHNPSKQIDDLLKDNNGYLVYQEDVIMFLQQVCGLSGSEADSIRRGIARKKPEILERAMPEILAGYCKNSPQPREVAEQEAKTFLRIIEDASSYMFGKNHSIAYCLIGYLCAYLRYYYPGEFITAYLNNAANQEDISAGTELAKERKIKILPIRFGKSGAHYMYDQENRAIYKGISSIKYMNDEVANALYEMGAGQYNCFSSVLLKVIPVLDSRQLEILINLGFFSDYGNSENLLEFYRIVKDVFRNGTAVTVSSEKIKCFSYEAFCDCYAKSGVPLKNVRIKDMMGLLNTIEGSVLADNSIPRKSISEQLSYQKEYMGYSDYTTNKEEDRRKIIVNDIYPVKRKSDGKIFLYTIATRSIGTGKESRVSISKRLYDENKISKGDILLAGQVCKNSRGYWQMLDYKKIS